MTLSGRVVDENEAPVAGARVSAHPGGQPPGVLLPPSRANRGLPAISSFPCPLLGPYLLDVDRAGYFQLTGRPIDVTGASTEVTLVLNAQREVFQSVTVGEMPAPVDPQQTQREQTPERHRSERHPLSSQPQSAQRHALIPGAIQDPTGGIHFHGGAEYQTRYTLDGFDITDPIDGRYTTLLAVEGVRIDGPGVLARNPAVWPRLRRHAGQIQTENGTDQFHYTATNFIPGVDFQAARGSATGRPARAFSGPLVKGRAWFSDSFNGEYNSGYVSGLPNGQNTNASWTAGNLFHAQVNLTPANILYADLLTNFDHQAHYGLGVLDPVSTTQRAERQRVAGRRQGFAYLVRRRGARSRLRLAARVPPPRSRRQLQTYVVSPNGRSGNYFVDSTEDGRREPALYQLLPPLVARRRTPPVADRRATRSAWITPPQIRRTGLTR